MIITICSDVLGKENNGTTIATMNLIRYLSSKGHEVRVVATSMVPVKNVKFYQLNVRNLGKIINTMLDHNQVILAKYDEQIFRKAIDGADIVDIPFSMGVSERVIDICKEKHIPVVASMHLQAENVSSHLGLIDSKIANRIIYNNYYKRIYSKVDSVHFPTEFLKNIFESNIKKTVKHPYVISNGVNDRFKRMNATKPSELKDKFVILSTGRICTEKNQKTLVDAVSKSKYKNKIKVIFAGDGPDKESLLKQINKKHVDAKVEFFSRDEIVNVINYSDLYVHTAIIDLESIACLEALKCGLTPVFMDSKRAAPHLFALDDRSLSKYKDSTDLANKIDYFIEHKDERLELSKQYEEKMSTMSQTECMHQMEEMFEETIDRYEKESDLL